MVLLRLSGHDLQPLQYDHWWRDLGLALRNGQARAGDGQSSADSHGRIRHRLRVDASDRNGRGAAKVICRGRKRALRAGSGSLH